MCFLIVSNVYTVKIIRHFSNMNKVHDQTIVKSEVSRLVTPET